MKNISIKEIAKLSGVSTATVSRVINNNGRFSEETRQKVLRVMEETGYQMNYSAKTLRMNKSFSIGILVPDITNYFFANVVEKIETILFDQGYSTIICNTGRNVEKEAAYLSMLEGKMIDGLIIISGADEFEFQVQNDKKTIPYICIDREPKEKNKTVFVSSNHYQGAFEAAEHLLQQGVKHPIIVMHQRNSSSAKERLDGFKDALKKNNYSFNPDKHRLDFNLDSSHDKKSLQEFLQQQNDVDGLFAINDDIALNILDYLREFEVAVPAQMKVIGFDNVPAGQHSAPRLTSINQDTQKIAEMATSSLIKLIDGNKEIQGEISLVPVQLIRREST
ncbi:LacI family DNA-binding transcriptional regulator [Enterococcus sp. 669A]|uniref:LacI family DNA-binding transcriptional regulator n=1 Tax=Candidatus Enterococcus moelleringii TaxID=2815325 RepID=A0ABS3L9G6_9ENTE|nr:LacI family DNA-binding transcriptional regulator [Enterococcus sp. 669A]MBO1306266.1 LacI family DNA-binding transcriptional regulator [Enterococcus sp. 669A]